ncbi:Alkaline proteinase [Paramyrothecium foliicola]|nr:Alkaline proteinase [Paramyrothecium foliicola]
METPLHSQVRQIVTQLTGSVPIYPFASDMARKFIEATVALAAIAAAFPVGADDIVPGKFIVTLQPSVGHELDLHTRWVSEVHAHNLHRRGGDTTGVDKTFDLPGFHAYSGSFDDATLEILRANESVLRVEPDRLVYLTSTATQENPPWGLSAISNANPPSPNSSYTYDANAGEGTFSYVMDSGILLEHVDFEGRAIFGINAFGESEKMHGTLVSAIVGGATFGVAKKTTIIDVQVTGDDFGSLSAWLEGIQWTHDDIQAKGRVGKSVINMSLGSNSNPTINNAVQVLIDAGIPVVVAAGNENSPASESSPGNLPDAITVGASDRNYRRGSFSNYGPSVDIFAPGVEIITASSDSPTANRTTRGTSEAAPHVAGAIAYLLGVEGPRTPAEIWTRLEELAIKDIIQDPQGSNNLFLYNGIGA